MFKIERNWSGSVLVISSSGNFSKVTEKYLCQGLILSEVAGYSSWCRSFTVNFAKFYKALFIEHLWTAASEWILCGGRSRVFKALSRISLRKKCSYSGFFWSVFSRIGSIFPYSGRMRENTDQKTPNTDTFHAVSMMELFAKIVKGLITKICYQIFDRF